MGPSKQSDEILTVNDYLLPIGFRILGDYRTGGFGPFKFFFRREVWKLLIGTDVPFIRMNEYPESRSPSIVLPIWSKQPQFFSGDVLAFLSDERMGAGQHPCSISFHGCSSGLSDLYIFPPGKKQEPESESSYDRIKQSNANRCSRYSNLLYRGISNTSLSSDIFILIFVGFIFALCVPSLFFLGLRNENRKRRVYCWVLMLPCFVLGLLCYGWGFIGSPIAFLGLCYWP